MPPDDAGRDPMRLPKAVLFDLDGTLAESVGDIRNALNLALSLKGVPPFSEDAVRRMIGAGALKLIIRAMLAADMTPNQFDAQYLKAAFAAAYNDAYCVETKLFPGTLGVLRELKTAGCKLAVVSNKPHDLTEKVVAGLGVRDMFDFVLGGTDAHALKPSGAMLVACTKALSVSVESVVMVGDSDNDVGAAQDAGCPVIVVDYGYTDLPAETLGADGVISDIDELIGTLAGVV